MKHKHLIFITIISLFLPAILYGQAWNGVLSASRAVDWSGAGVLGGIPSASWTQCGSTVSASGASSATVNSAIAACGNNQFVLLGPGTFNLATGIDFAGRSNVALRGSGANQTFLVFGATANGCHGGYGAWVDICIYSAEGNWSGGPSNSANWTAGYTKGTTSITLSSVTNLHVGQPLMLDQNDDAKDTGSVFVCQSNAISPPCSLEGNSGATRANREQSQIVTVAGISGTTVTIKPGLYMSNWSSSQSPGAWWATHPVASVGIENLSLDHTASKGNKGIEIADCTGCWVSGVRSIDSGKAHVEIAQSNHVTVQNSYFYLTQSSISQSYGIEALNSADDLYVNNIIQYVASPLMINGPCTGCVVAYNYTINNYYSASSGYNIDSALNHTAGEALMLFEGNYGNGFTGDNFHGTHNLITQFRNYWVGNQPACYSGSANTFAACNNNRMAFDLRAYSRFFNLVGNVLGQSGVHTTYQSSGAADKSIYALNAGNTEGSVTVPSDSLVASTLVRWGNYDVVTGAARWCGNSSNTGWSSTCGGTSEVPTGLSNYANPVPTLGDTAAGQGPLPASFYSPSKPGWWPSGKPWPAIGPDVTGGNVAGMGGHANTLPAQDCFTNVMGGAVNGSGNVSSFNASSCYSGSSTPPPAPPASGERRSTILN